MGQERPTYDLRAEQFGKHRMRRCDWFGVCAMGRNKAAEWGATPGNQTEKAAILCTLTTCEEVLHRKEVAESVREIIAR